MPDFEIRVQLKNVTVGDAEDVAQSVWDQFAEPLDAAIGEFGVTIHRVERANRPDIHWEPRSRRAS